jgi:hypothetical protein
MVVRRVFARDLGFGKISRGRPALHVFRRRPNRKTPCFRQSQRRQTLIDNSLRLFFATISLSVHPPSPPAIPFLPATCPDLPQMARCWQPLLLAPGLHSSLPRVYLVFMAFCILQPYHPIHQPFQPRASRNVPMALCCSISAVLASLRTPHPGLF